MPDERRNSRILLIIDDAVCPVMDEPETNVSQIYRVRNWTKSSIVDEEEILEKYFSLQFKTGRIISSTLLLVK